MFYFMEQNAFSEFKNINTHERKIEFMGENTDAQTSTEMTIEGTRAIIPIRGVLSKEYDAFTDLFFGSTGYDDIIEEIYKAESDPRIKEIIFEIDSVGGSVVGLFDAVDVIYSMKKPTKSYVTGMCASAAYALASQTDSIICESRGSMVGSIGVVATVHVDDSVVEITSTDAPNKRPDVQTPEGRETVRGELDEIHELFVEAIARGRNKTIQTINTDFGRGSTFLAGKALERGMIDSIGAIDTKPFLLNAIKSEVIFMDAKTLQRDFPEVYEQIFTLGVTNERERVEAHLTLGKTCGALDIALDAIETGVSCGTLMQTKYLAKGMKKTKIDERAVETKTIPAVDNISTETKTSDDDAMKVALLVKKQFCKK